MPAQFIDTSDLLRIGQDFPLSIRSVDATALWRQKGEADWVCVLGVSASLGQIAEEWLAADRGRRLIFIEEEEEYLSDPALICLLKSPQVQIYLINALHQWKELAGNIGWKAVFKQLSVIGLSKDASSFEEALRTHHQAAFLLLSDWADQGEGILKRSLTHWKEERGARPALGLQGRFDQIPAIICGGGPSLEACSALLDPNRALIFAGGAALSRLPVEPHFGASIDREASYEEFKKGPFSQLPFFYQTRMNPQNFSLIHGEKLYVPDGCHPAETWLGGSDALFDGGWTVGTFLISLALHMGCNPIILVGMDFCYQEDRKYAFSSEKADLSRSVQVQNQEGKNVWTQPDWLMAVSWIAELAERRWDRTFIDASEGGLGFASPVQKKKLSEIDFPPPIDLAGKIHAELMRLPLMQPPTERIGHWEESIRRCFELARSHNPDGWEEEIAYQKFLYPLWQIWRPIFERELEVDGVPLPLPDKLRFNQFLFFQQVLHGQIE